MTKGIPDASEVRIAALHQKDRVRYYDLMKAGPGTPWEDRGSLGTPVAFLKTCAAAMRRPVALFHAIRRPETGRDALGFAVGCGLIWGLSWVLHGVLWVIPRWAQASKGHLIAASVGQLLIATGAAFLFVRFAGSLLHKLVSGDDMLSKAPAVLTHNLFAYALGPCLVALIPFAGPPIALLWTVALMVVAGVKRQHIRPAGALICTLLVTLLCLGIAVAAYFVGWWVWVKVSDGGVFQ